MNTNNNTYTEPVESKCRKRRAGHKDQLSGIIMGIIFILAGGWILADTHVYLFAGWFWWFIFSAGIVLLGEAGIRAVVPQFRARFYHSLIWGAIFLTVGAGNIFNIDNLWPLAFIFVGIIMILYAQKHYVKLNA
jgi:hypothetical protein